MDLHILWKMVILTKNQQNKDFFAIIYVLNVKKYIDYFYMPC